MSKIKVFTSDSFDPWFNLAIEDWIFRDMDPEYAILFLWRNDKTVVIGRFQNPWTECNTQKMEQDNIKLARRQSGGGAVFHDLGNTNFTFMNSKETFNKDRNFKIILNALKNFDIFGNQSGRNDLTVKDGEGDKKFSGSAFKETKDRSFHHGTLLLDANLSMLSNYLNPHPKKLESKGIQSVKSRVINLKELNTKINHEEIQNSIISEFFKEYGANVEITNLKVEEIKGNEKLNAHYERLKDWNWRFGEAPNFTHKISEYFSWGLVEVYMNVEKAIVKECNIYSDSLHPEMIEVMMASLNNITYNKSSFENKLNSLIDEYPMYGDYLKEFGQWIQKEIN